MNNLDNEIDNACVFTITLAYDTYFTIVARAASIRCVIGFTQK